MDKIETLYRNYEILSAAGDSITEHEREYREILNAVKGSSQEKCLASQFIGKFFKHFPALADAAIDAQLDLCEDEEIQIRRQAIKNLPLFCKDTVEHTTKIGDTLTQLLILDDPIELKQVYLALNTIIKVNPKGALAGIFSQINTGDEITREKSFKFIASKVMTMESNIITKEIENYIIEEIKRVLQDVTSEEFHLCMNILKSTKLGNTITGHVELVNLAMEQAELNADIDAITIEEEIVERFIQCSNHAIPYFSSQIKSTPFVVFVCDKLLPLSTWGMLATTEHEGQTQLRLLKVFAEMCSHCGILENATTRIETVYTTLREYMPLPKLDEEFLKTPPSFQFSHAECLLFALHTLGKQNNEKFSFLNDGDNLKDFRSRLQFLARGTQGYIKKLEEAVKVKSNEELKSEENQLKLTALKTTSNISLLIRDLFHSPPSFKADIQLSWTTKKVSKFGNKRHAQITFESEESTTNQNKVKKGKSNFEQKVYVPPSGKYSAKVQNYSSNRNNLGNANMRNKRRYIKK